jgi:hypothetical protein
MKKVEKTLAPRLPKEAREKLKSGGTHKNKKAYKRKEKHSGRNDSAAFILPKTQSNNRQPRTMFQCPFGK